MGSALDDDGDPGRGPLERLDASLVPRLARGARRSVDAVTGPPETFLAARAAGYDLRASLALVDARHARRGLLRLFREIPQVAFLTVGLLLFAGGGTVLALEDNGTSTEQTSTDPLSGGSVATVVGPSDGAPVAAYLTERQSVLAARAQARPKDTALAVVSFAAVTRPADIAGILGPDLTVRSFQVHVQVDGTPTGVAVVAAPVGPLAAAVDALAAKLVSAVPGLQTGAMQNQAQGDTTQVLNPNDAAQKQAYYDEAAAQNLEVTAFSMGGASVVGVVVSGTLAQLAALAAQPAVRLVDVAPAGTQTSSAAFRTVLPTDTATVAVVRPIDELAGL